ncbi:MAG: hypothetical protein EBX02_11995 [Betaproteobacteria bacterium]|nr:hypothetical protein [Betaproteobacteria bacterium]
MNWASVDPNPSLSPPSTDIERWVTSSRRNEILAKSAKFALAQWLSCGCSVSEQHRHPFDTSSLSQ